MLEKVNNRSRMGTRRGLPGACGAPETRSLMASCGGASLEACRKMLTSCSPLAFSVLVFSNKPSLVVVHYDKQNRS